MRRAGLAFAAVLVWAQPAAVAPDRAPLVLESPVQDKNFFVLSKIERSERARDAVNANAALRELGAAKLATLRKAAVDCGADAACNTAALKFGETEIASAGQALREVYGASPDLRRLVEGDLRRSGLFQRYTHESGEELLARAWADAAHGIDRIIEVYAEGRAPRYPEIDSATYDVKSDAWRRTIQIAVAELEDDHAALVLFFQPALRFAVTLLDINGRDEAGRLEPLEKGENAAAVQRVASVDWNKFAYSVIVVPGAGSDRTSVALSPNGKLRLMLAARRYREGKAPFLLVSGGYVHPAQTPWCEALEMKKYLMARLRIPENAILIDPHARHTTTNIRNAAREIYRYGIPFDKPALITTDQFQSASIESAAFGERCMRELGYRPYRLARRVSAFDLEFGPVLEALQGDAADPLDP